MMILNFMFIMIVGFLIGITLFKLIELLLNGYYNIYIKQTKQFCNSYVDYTYEDFIDFYKNTDWEENSGVSYEWTTGIPSKFTADNSSMLHASVIRNNNIGIILTRKDWKKAIAYVREDINKNKKEDK